nr:transposase [Cupriavidus lacunae]
MSRSKCSPAGKELRWPRGCVRTIEIVARDRAGAYSEAVDIALPAATQVSDRWHLLCNLRDNVERLLCRLGPQLRQAAQQVEVRGATAGSGS